jgi:HPr kinase/phosphorylase
MGTVLTVEGLLRSRPEAIGLPLELLGGASGLSRSIVSPHIQKTGLALAGFHQYLHPGRVLVFGESEVTYLEGLDAPRRADALAAAFAYDIPCVLLTGGGHPSPELSRAAEACSVPVLRTPVTTPIAIARLTALLEDALAVRQMIHGVLLDILGLGVLIVGESGIGKSECALDLVVRGHRLVADDVVEVRRRSETVIIGTCPELTRHHMEVRGLGVINIQDLFGVASTRSAKRVELVVQLERWEPPSRGRADISQVAALATQGLPPGESDSDHDRLGLDDRAYELLGQKIPMIRMPVAAGRSLAILVEVAARNQILKARGRHAARDLAARLDRVLRDDEDGGADADIDAEGEDGGDA